MVIKAPTQQIRRQQTRRRLIEAAMAVWARRGYEACSVDDVARAAGVSKGAVYFHFASKEDLLLEVVDLQMWRDQQRILELVGADAPALNLRHLLTLGRGLSEPGDPWPRLLQELWCHAARNPRVGERLAEMYQKRREILHRHLRGQFEAASQALQVEPEEVCNLLLAAMDGLLVQNALNIPWAAGREGPLPNAADTADELPGERPSSGDGRGSGRYQPAAAS